MAAPQPPTTEPQAPQPTETPAPATPVEDRILSPEETGNLLRGYNLSDAEQRRADADDTPPDQQQMAQEFFAEIPPQGVAPVPDQVPLPHEQVAQTQAPPGVPPVGYVEQAAQQTQIGPTPGIQQAPAYAPGSQIPAGPSPTPVPVQIQQSPEMAALQAQNQMLMQQMSTIQSQVQAQAQAPIPPGRPGYQAPEAPKPTYNFQVPAQYLAGIQSENSAEASHALNALLNGVAEAVTAQVRQEQQVLRDEVDGLVRSTVNQSSTEQEIQRDMYGTYPELAGHRDFVQAAARRLSQTMGNQTPWSADLRDQIAEQVAPMIPGLYQKVQQVKAQRIGAYAIPQQAYGQAASQPLPQQQQSLGLPAGVQPVGVVGGVHAPPPVLARDAAGNLVHVQSAPQPYLGSAQARQSGSTVPSDVMDIWRTLGYEPYQ